MIQCEGSNLRSSSALPPASPGPTQDSSLMPQGCGPQITPALGRGLAQYSLILYASHFTPPSADPLLINYFPQPISTWGTPQGGTIPVRAPCHGTPGPKELCQAGSAALQWSSRKCTPPQGSPCPSGRAANPPAPARLRPWSAWRVNCTLQGPGPEKAVLATPHSRPSRRDKRGGVARARPPVLWPCYRSTCTGRGRN